MTRFRMAPAVLAVALLSGAASAEERAVLQAGAYEVDVRLEIPNVWNWSAKKTETICLPRTTAANEPPLPVLSGNNPLAKCSAKDIRMKGAGLSFIILCEGRDAAKARAAYVLSPGAFKGRIVMIMGGKNMTMTEVQEGRRIGNCDRASAARH
jgi:hypothetical protein